MTNLITTNLIDCCKKCPNRKISGLFCYNGQSIDSCPSYQDYGKTKLANNPPKNIEALLQKN